MEVGEKRLVLKLWHNFCSRITSPIHSSFHPDRYTEWGTGFGGLLLPWQLLGKFLRLPVYICMCYLKRSIKMTVHFRCFIWIKHRTIKTLRTSSHQLPLLLTTVRVLNVAYYILLLYTVSNLVLGLRGRSEDAFPEHQRPVVRRPISA